MSCVGTPVSWPRLEGFAAGALAPELATEILAHVGACPACRACLEQIRSDVDALPPLPAVAAARARAWGGWSRWLGAGSVAVAAVAVLLLVLAWPRPVPEPPQARVRVKGAGEVVLTLVRERAGAVVFDPSSFRPEDRFKIRVTCAPGSDLFADVVVLQGPDVSYPFPSATTLACGNDVTLPGAFRVTGRTPALVCVVLSADGPVDRAARPPGVRACARVAPEP